MVRPAVTSTGSREQEHDSYEYYYGGDYDKSVEVLRKDGTWCSLPNIPENFHSHTQTGLEICGGETSPSSCIKFSGGKWKPSHKLNEGPGRQYHSSWASH